MKTLRICLLPFMLAACLPAFGHAADVPQAQWLVVTAPAFRDALETLCQHRKTQGMRVVVVQTTDVLSREAIRTGDGRKLCEQVAKLTREHKGPTYVLLVGAVEAGKLPDADKKVLPPLHGTTGRMKGQMSDNGYGSPGEDRLPTTAVGRWPARSEDEVKVMVQKTLAFERDNKPGTWRRRVTMLLGNPGGGSALEKGFAESFVEGAYRTQVQRLHASWSTRTIMHCSQSPYCLPDADLHDRSSKYLREGQLFTIYAGHSSAGGLWSDGARFLNREDWSKLTMTGILVSCGCFGCQYSGRDGEGYGVAAMRNANGPVAVVGATGESYSAMGHLAFQGMVESFTTSKLPPRLGDVWRSALSGISKENIDAVTFGLLDAADGSGGRTPLDVQRREHLEMWVLLGDPALRLPDPPVEIPLTSTGAFVAGGMVTVRGKAPASLEGATVRITLSRPLESTPADLPSLPKNAEDRDRVMRARHDLGNRFEVITKEAVIRDGKLETRLELPPKLPWPKVIVQVQAVKDSLEGLGVLVAPVK